MEFNVSRLLINPITFGNTFILKLVSIRLEIGKLDIVLVGN